jgi:hypothetical protein
MDSGTEPLEALVSDTRWVLVLTLVIESDGTPLSLGKLCRAVLILEGEPEDKGSKLLLTNELGIDLDCFLFDFMDKWRHPNDELYLG